MLRRVFWNRDRIFSVHGVFRALRPSGLSKAPGSVSSYAVRYRGLPDTAV
jgi:hypothetical protein